MSYIPSLSDVFGGGKKRDNAQPPPPSLSDRTNDLRLLHPPSVSNAATRELISVCNKAEDKATFAKGRYHRAVDSLAEAKSSNDVTEQELVGLQEDYDNEAMQISELEAALQKKKSMQQSLHDKIVLQQKFARESKAQLPGLRDAALRCQQEYNRCFNGYKDAARKLMKTSNISYEPKTVFWKDDKAVERTLLANMVFGMPLQPKHQHVVPAAGEPGGRESSQSTNNLAHSPGLLSTNDAAASLRRRTDSNSRFASMTNDAGETESGSGVPLGTGTVSLSPLNTSHSSNDPLAVSSFTGRGVSIPTRATGGLASLEAPSSLAETNAAPALESDSCNQSTTNNSGPALIPGRDDDVRLIAEANGNDTSFAGASSQDGNNPYDGDDSFDGLGGGFDDGDDEDSQQLTLPLRDESRHTICKFAGCSTLARRKGGFCIRHGDKTTRLCRVEGCTKVSRISTKRECLLAG